MLTITKAAALYGIKGIEVTVEVDLTQGLPYFNIIGLGDISVKESADRVKNAILNCKLPFPTNRITVNLSPAWIHKRGSAYDLAIAIGVLSSETNIPNEKLLGKAFLGELSLDGSVMPVKGILPMISGLMGKVDTVYLPAGNCKEAWLITKDSNLKIIAAKNLSQVYESLKGSREPEYYSPSDNLNISEDSFQLDFKDVKGHEQVKEAITIAVSGSHGILLMGSPGTGKSMLASRIPSILPPMNSDEILETSMIYSLLGKLDEESPVIDKRPFRELNSKSTETVILGGGLEPYPGEISLANNGILFMDELLEFDRKKIELLRKPLEEKKITLIRRGNAFTFPAKFTFVAASNPCKCGYLGDSLKRCKCTQGEIDRYRSRLSGPICERIDMFVEIVRVDFNLLNGMAATSSKEMYERVMVAREIQNKRFENLAITANSQMEPSQISMFCNLGERERMFMEKAYARYALSPRRYHRILKVARTMADMNKNENIGIAELACALGYTRLLENQGEGM